MRGINVESVSRWLAANVADAAPPFEFELIAGGRSNLTYLVTDATGVRTVLRRPPLGHLLASAHDMAREHTIISAVGATGVPVPRTLGLCTDVDVNEAPFYVMSYVEGNVLDSPEKAESIPNDTRRALSEHLIDVLADLHAVDIDAVGLGNLAKRGGYVERQLKRWSTQWDNSKTRELPAIDEVRTRLYSDIPEQRHDSIAHGDYRFGNCLSDVASGRIVGVLDWELCTLGDPLADVGYLGVYWSDGPQANGRANDPTPAGGFLTYDEIVHRYATRTGRDVSRIDYYRAFSSWRLAIISEGVYARYLHGQMGDAEPGVIDGFREGVDNLAAAALAAVRRLG